jgi:hypothetical protein
MAVKGNMAMSADRNLLFGILALQMDFLTRDALIAAMHAWVLDKAKPLGQILVEQQAIRDDERELLEALVDKHLEKHGNDAEQSLAVVTPAASSLRQQLAALADPDVQGSLAHLGKGTPTADPESTGPYLGSALGQRFRVLRPHRAGGLGEVFVAYDEELRREVALKHIQQRHADDPDSRGRFLRDAEITGGLEHLFAATRGVLGGDHPSIMITLRLLKESNKAWRE